MGRRGVKGGVGVGPFSITGGSKSRSGRSSAGDGLDGYRVLLIIGLVFALVVVVALPFYLASLTGLAIVLWSTKSPLFSNEVRLASDSRIARVLNGTLSFLDKHTSKEKDDAVSEKAQSSRFRQKMQSLVGLALCLGNLIVVVQDYMPYPTHESENLSNDWYFTFALGTIVARVVAIPAFVISCMVVISFFAKSRKRSRS